MSYAACDLADSPGCGVTVELARLELDAMTPLEALTVLYELQAKAKGCQ